MKKHLVGCLLGIAFLLACEKPENENTGPAPSKYPITYTFSGVESISPIKIYNSSGPISGATNHPSAEDESITDFMTYYNVDIAPLYDGVSFKFISNTKVINLESGDTGAYVRIGQRIIVENAISFIEKDGKLILNMLHYSIVKKEGNVTSQNRSTLAIFESLDADMKEIMLDRPDTAAARSFDLVYKKQ